MWNLITTWWIYNSTEFGASFAILVNSSFYSLMMVIYRISLNIIPKITSQILLLSMWISFEKFHLNWDFSWPWLNLGNVFSESIYFIQWYEYTGVFGGTLWIIAVNFLIMNLIEKWREIFSRKEIILKTLTIVLLVITPIIFFYHNIAVFLHLFLILNHLSYYKYGHYVVNLIYFLQMLKYVDLHKFQHQNLQKYNLH